MILFPLQLDPDPPGTFLPAPDPLPRLVAYGDSYTGTRGGEGPYGWLHLTADAFGLEPVNNARSGSGYVTVGSGITWPYEATVGAVDRTAGVVVLGSQNDRMQDPDAIGLAMQVTLTVIGWQNPGVPVLIVGPFWPWDGPPNAAALAARDAVRDVAAARGVPFLDPLGEDWPHSRPGLIGPDGSHPTLAGQALIAGRVQEALAPLLRG